jgi:hypothetical protein
MHNWITPRTPWVFVFGLVLTTAACNKDSATTNSITVTYKLDKFIADAAEVAVPREEWTTGEPAGKVEGKIKGDATHPTQVAAKVFPDYTKKVDSIVLSIPSPGYSGGEKLAVISVTFKGKDLIVEYEKTSSSENMEDFRQFTSYVRVTREGGSQQAAGDSPKSFDDPYKDVASDEPIIHHALTGEVGSDGWCQAQPTRGNFSIMLPGQYTDVMTKSKTTAGGTGVLHTVSTTNSSGIEFTVLQTEILGEKPGGSTTLELLTAKFESIGATMTKVDVVIADIKGVRLSVKTEGVAAEMILLSLANSDYQLAVQAAPEKLTDAENMTEFERFFESFEVARPN